MESLVVSSFVVQSFESLANDFKMMLLPRRTLKVWDVQGASPHCVPERPMELGELHTLDGCPDAPFVVCAGGDLARDNLRVWDVREAASVRARFGRRQLSNPLGASAFAHATLAEAETEAKDEEGAMQEAPPSSSSSGHVVGGAAGKFRKKKNKKREA